MEAIQHPPKPLGHRAYGSIPHLPGSRLGPSDLGITAGQAQIATGKARDKRDMITVTEKLDGSCVSVARIGGQLVPLVRAGYSALSSPHDQHLAFHSWVTARTPLFMTMLEDGERVVGEWLAQAHGTRYRIRSSNTLFAPFDILKGTKRIPFADLQRRIAMVGLVSPMILAARRGAGVPVDEVEHILGEFGYRNAIDAAEGAVWRVERDGQCDFLAKFVRHGKEDGKFLESVTGQGPVWNFKQYETGYIFES